MTEDPSRAKLRELYKLYRKALMNKEYYGARQAAIGRAVFTLDVFLAIGTSSAVGAWAIFKTQPGEVFWSIVSAIVVLVTIVRPFLKLGDELTRLTTLSSEYGVLFHDLREIVEDATLKQQLPNDFDKRFSEARKRYRQAAAKDDTQPNAAELQRAYDAVMVQLPLGSLWIPGKGDTSATQLRIAVSAKGPALDPPKPFPVDDPNEDDDLAVPEPLAKRSDLLRKAIERMLPNSRALAAVSKEAS